MASSGVTQGMITIQMSEDEARAFIVMLERASEEFGNHGCNDFLVDRELNIPKAQAEEVAKALRVAMVEDKILDPDAVNDTGTNLYDWTILSWLKVKIRTALTPGPG